MMLRRVVLLTFVSTLALGACSKKKPAQPQPQPETPTQVTTRDPNAEAAAQRERDRLRQDSINAANAARDAQERAARIAALRSSIEAMIYFDYNEDKLRDDAAEELSRKAQILRANADIHLRITGHTDERGSVEYNQALGMRRAQVTKDFLTGFGIDGGRLEIVSMGEDQPQDPGHDESAWGRNRRAAFTITAGSPVVTPGQ
jgi:peptidoglycan-associated lipoprotein